MKRNETGLSPADGARASSPSGEANGPSLATRIEARLGLVPNFFRLAPEAPEIAGGLWGFAGLAYLDSPLPPLFKERLFVILSRYCDVRYCLVRHLGFLLGQGRPAGDALAPRHSIEQAIRLLRRALPRGDELASVLADLRAAPAPLDDWPPPDSVLETALFAAATHIFLETGDAAACLEALRPVLGGNWLQYLLLFIGFVRTAHYWTRIHGELDVEADIDHLLAAHPDLAEAVTDSMQTESAALAAPPRRELDARRLERNRLGELLETETVLHSSERQLRDTAAELAERVAELEQKNKEVLEARRAALNIMEDAIQSRNQVHESEARFGALVAVLTDVPWTTDEAGRFVTPQEAWATYTGQSWEEYSGFGWLNAIHAEDRPRVLDAWEHARSLNATYFAEGRLWHAPSQAYRHFEARATPLVHANGSVREWVGACTDVHGRKRVEQALRKSELRFRTLFDLVPVGIYTCDAEGMIQEYNQQASLLWQREPAPHERFCGSLNLFHPDGSPMPHDAGPVARALRGEAVSEHDAEMLIERPDGSRRMVLAIPRVFYGEHREISGAINCLHDITDRKVHEQRLAEQARLLSLTNDAIIVRGAHNRIVYWNQGAAEVFGYSSQEALGKSAHKLLQTEFPEPLEAINAVLLRDNRWTGRLTHTRRDGTRIVTLSRWALDRDENGRPFSVLESNNDITERELAADQLRDSEARYRATFDNAAVGIAQIGLDGRWLQFNDAVCKITGYPRDELSQMTFQEITHPDDLSLDLEHVQRLLAGEISTYSLEKRYLRRDGRTVWVDLTVSLLLDRQGQPQNYVSVIEEITERKQAEDALRDSEFFYRQTLESIPGMTFTFRPDGYCDYQSQQWGEFTGVPVAEQLGLGWKNLLHPEDRPRAEAAWRTAMSGLSLYDLEYRVRRFDGLYEWFKVIARPIRDEEGQIVRWLGVAANIHVLKQAEEALREADRRKDEFLAMLAHELRNPLAPIRTGLQLIRVAHEDPATVERTRAMMERQLEQLVRLVDDLMDVSRITRGKLVLKRERVLLADVLQSAVETSRPLLEQMQHRLEVQLPPADLAVHGDFTRLVQVFMNLLTNAAKYSEPRGYIWLTATRRGQTVAVSVRDTGVGIAKEHLARIFDLFTQVDHSLERSQGGLGIGLTLVKRLVEMHGGTIQADSGGLRRGSEFTVTLPILEKPGAAVEVAEPAPLTGLRSALRILIVDDNQAAADSLAAMLELLGSETSTCYDGLKGVELAEQLQPDVILLDIGLPNLNGYEACRRIRQQFRGRQPVIVACTGWGQEEDRRQSREAGFDHHLVKPVNPQELLKLLAAEC